jgi:hypothetical protein
MTAATSQRSWPIGNAGHAPSLATLPKEAPWCVEPALRHEYFDALSSRFFRRAPSRGFPTSSLLLIKPASNSDGGEIIDNVVRPIPWLIAGLGAHSGVLHGQAGAEFPLSDLVVVVS